MIEVTQDPSNGIAYIRLSDETVVRTIEVTNTPANVQVLIDYDDAGTTVGYQFLA